MSALAAVLPMVWATVYRPVLPELPAQPKVEAGIAFYRRYTESLLHRYLRLSTESGKIPCLLGKEMFRARVTNYRVDGFDDAVIFVHDIERCLNKLDPQQKELIARITLYQYPVAETAQSMGLKPRTLVRRYGQALDRLTRIFLYVKLLEPMKACQGGGPCN